MRTNLQPEIATTGVRTGLAMTNGAAFPFGGTVPHSLIPSFFISTTAGAFDRSRFFLKEVLYGIQPYRTHQ